MFFFAVQNVLSRPVRSFLAVLGMTVAIMGMVSLFAIAAGLDQIVSNTLSRVPGLVAMQRGAPIPLFSTLPRSWLDELEAIPGVHAVSPECWSRANVIDGKMVISPPRLLCGSDISRRNRLNTAVYRDDIVEGRFLNDDDLDTMNCIVSRQIAAEFGKTIGDTLEVNGYDLKIVGIYYTGSMLLDVAIFMDDTRFREMARFDENTVSSYYIEQDGTVPDAELLASIQNQFRGRGPTNWQGSSLLLNSSENPLSQMAGAVDQFLKSFASNPTTDNEGDTEGEAKETAATGETKATGNAAVTPATQEEEPAQAGTSADSGSKHTAETTVAADPMEVRLATDWAGRIDKFAEDLDIALWLLTSIGIFIAVVSIINTMLMSVTERVSEFGILRANGWSRLNLIQLIAWESFLLGLTGGLLGCLLGWGLTLTLNQMFPERFHLFASPDLLLFALVFSSVLGVFSGLYPAIWAARLNPMDAIRRN